MDETRAIRAAPRKPRRLPALVRPGRAPVRYYLGIRQGLRRSTADARRVLLSAALAQQNSQEDAFDLPATAPRRPADQTASAAAARAARGRP